MLLARDARGQTPNFPIKSGVGCFGVGRMIGCMKSFGGLWEEVKGNGADYNFFKVTVEMP